LTHSLAQVKIVVGILNKDCAKQLRECLDSLLDQSFRDFVVVVVDGGSKDDSLKVLQEYSKKDARIQYFVQKSKGTGMARNELINYVKGKFPNCEKIIWGDAENVYDREYLKNIVSRNACIIGGVNIIDSEKPLAQSLWWYYNGWQGEAVSGNNECVDIKVYEKYRYANVIRGDDFIFHQELAKNGYKFDHCAQAVCYIKTVESLGDLINWTKKKAIGLFQYASQKKKLPSLLTRYVFFNVVMWIYIILLSVSFFVSSFLVVTCLFPPLMLSMYFWQKGKRYVRRMRKITFFYFIPVLFLHFTIMFFELLKLSLGTQLSRENL